MGKPNNRCERFLEIAHRLIILNQGTEHNAGKEKENSTASFCGEKNFIGGAAWRIHPALRHEGFPKKKFCAYHSSIDDDRVLIFGVKHADLKNPWKKALARGLVETDAGSGEKKKLWTKAGTTPGPDKDSSVHAVCTILSHIIKPHRQYDFRHRPFGNSIRTGRGGTVESG